MVRAGAAVEARDPRSTALSRCGGIAAMLETAVLLIGLVGFAVSLPGFGLRNWLVVLFEINAGVGDLPVGPLRVLNVLDVAVLVFVGVTFLGLWPALHHRIWMGIGVALPFVGIVLLFVTKQAGRSALMGAGLVIAFLMLTNHSFKPLAYLGILANMLLLVGDLATRGSRVPVVAALVAVGYVLLLAWFFLIGMRLLGWVRSRQGAGVGRHT